MPVDNAAAIAKAGSVNYYEKFHAYLVELMQSYSKLGELLTKKLDAILKFDIATLDDIMKEEQVFVLLSRGFDANIRSYREKLSLKGDSLSEVIAEMPEEYRSDFQSVFTRFKAKLDEVKSLNERCQNLIEERIYTLEQSIRRLDKTGSTPYVKPGASAAVTGAGAHILKKSI